MTGNQASPAPAALHAAHAEAAHPHHPVGDHVIGRRSADLPLAAVRKTARYAPVLLGGVAAAVLAWPCRPWPARPRVMTRPARGLSLGS